MSEVKRMYELLYEERWDEKKQKERRNEEAFFSPESPITREIPIEELFDVLDDRAGQQVVLLPIWKCI